MLKTQAAGSTCHTWSIFYNFKGVKNIRTFETWNVFYPQIYRDFSIQIDKQFRECYDGNVVQPKKVNW